MLPAAEDLVRVMYRKFDSCQGLAWLFSHIFRLSSCANDEIGAVIKNCKQTMNTINPEVLQTLSVLF